MQKPERARNKPLSWWLVLVSLMAVIVTLAFWFFMWFLPRWVVEELWWWFELIGLGAALVLFAYWWRNGTIYGRR